MACNESEIWAHADGETSPEVEEHVRACADCAALLDEARLLTARLQEELAVTVPKRAVKAPWHRWAASAAAVLLAVFVLTMLRTDAVAQVEIFTPVVAGEDSDIVVTRTTAKEGSVLEFTGSGYGRLRYRGESYLFTPGTKIRINNGIELIRGGFLLGEANTISVSSQRTAYLLGFEAWRRKDFVEAAERFREAAPDPKLGEVAHFYWGGSLGRAKKYDEAIAVLREFLVKYPESRHRDYVELFIGVYTERRPRKPMTRSRPAYLPEAFARAYRENRFGDAAEILEQQDARNGQAMFYLWVCRGRLGQVREAVRVIDRFVRSFPRDRNVPYSLYFKAVYLSRLGRKAEALAALERIEREYPGSTMMPHVRELRRRLR